MSNSQASTTSFKALILLLLLISFSHSRRYRGIGTSEAKKEMAAEDSFVVSERPSVASSFPETLERVQRLGSCRNASILTELIHLIPGLNYKQKDDLCKLGVGLCCQLNDFFSQQGNCTKCVKCDRTNRKLFLYKVQA